ncbi:nipblb, partial [Symbiodinium necroappetens]
MVYKIGYSYDPHNRFFNRSFGYVHERQKWEKMIVVYVSHETLGPAFLEAALIQRFKGQQGCRNERDGGDTV